APLEMRSRWRAGQLHPIGSSSSATACVIAASGSTDAPLSDVGALGSRSMVSVVCAAAPSIEPSEGIIAPPEGPAAAPTRRSQSTEQSWLPARGLAPAQREARSEAQAQAQAR